MQAYLEREDLDAIRAVVREELTSHVPPRLLTVDQAAEYVGRPVQGFRKFAKKWGIPVASPDSRVLYDRADLDRLIEDWKHGEAA